MEFHTIKNIPINLIINHCIAFNWHCREGSNETRVAINCENVCYSIHHQLLVLIHMKFKPEIICAVGNRIQQLGSIYFSLSNGVAGKLLLMPFQPSCPLDGNHAFGPNTQSSCFYHKSDQREIEK